MWIVFDLLVIGIIALCTFIGYKQGLVKAIIKILSFVIAIVIALILYKPVSNIIIKNTSIDDNIKNATIDAGQSIEVNCKVTIPNLSIKDIKVQTYCCKLSDNGEAEDIIIVPMKMVKFEEEYNRYYFTAKINIATGGEYGYTFIVLPNHEMLLDSENLDLIKWIGK